MGISLKHYKILRPLIWKKRRWQKSTLHTVLTLAEAIISERYTRGTPITSAEDALPLLRAKFATLEHQVLAGLLLDYQHRILACLPLCTGTLQHTAVYPREIIKIALQQNAAALILAQNQPSGLAKPGAQVTVMARALQKLLSYLEIQLLDYFILGGNTVFSLSQHGMFRRWEPAKQAERP